MSKRWVNRPEGSNWGEFGHDDQRGAMNLVGVEQVRKGIDEVVEGKSFSLSLPLDMPGGNALHPMRHPPRHFATLRGGKNAGDQCTCFAMSRENPLFDDVFSDDVVLLHTQYSTQWDGLAHAGAEFDADGDGVEEIVFYNGYRADKDMVLADRTHEGGDARWDTWEGPKAKALGIENLAEHGAQGRGVMVDLHRHYGEENHAVTYEDLMSILEKDKVVIERGDMVCFYTGLDDLIIDGNGTPDREKIFASCAGLDGGDERLLNWLTDTGIAALISDNIAVELMPKELRSESRHSMLPLHNHCLFKNGIHLGELWRLGELARWLRDNQRSRFLLTAAPLNLPGAVGSPLTPVATV